MIGRRREWSEEIELWKKDSDLEARRRRGAVDFLPALIKADDRSLRRY
jgi:hypothetical protein